MEEIYVKKNLDDELFHFVKDIFCVEEESDDIVISLELKELLKENDKVKIELKIDNTVINELEVGRRK